MNESAQEQWRQDKWGMFSASEIHKLTVGGSNGAMFGKGAHTYIKSKAREAITIYNDRDDAQSWAMKMGTVDEPEAFQHLYGIFRERVPNLQYFGDANPLFEKYCADSGSSPDCLAPYPGGISFGAEFKCPQGDTHFEYLEELTDHESLRDYSPQTYQYFCQCQFLMMTFKCDHWLWCSYNSYFESPAKMLVIEIPFDKKWAANMDIRLKSAIKLKYQHIEKIKEKYKI